MADDVFNPNPYGLSLKDVDETNRMMQPVRARGDGTYAEPFTIPEITEAMRLAGADEGDGTIVNSRFISTLTAMLAKRGAVSESEKLVRDRFTWLPHRVALPEEMPALLLTKLREEVAELEGAFSGNVARDGREVMRECADIVEVCYALGNIYAPGSLNAVERERLAKRAARGAFRRRIVMKLADLTDKPA